MSPNPPSSIPPRTRTRFLWAGLVSLLAWILLSTVAPGTAVPWTPAMRRASVAMDSALSVVRAHCADQGIPIDAGTDPNGTCMVGPDVSPLLTSLGQVEAKRTSTTPDVAALLVHLLARSGVGAGDKVAIGASGSFPALLVASVVATEALGARAVPILSLGASSYGATRPELNLLDILSVLNQSGVVSARAEGISLGGAGDVGRELDPDFRKDLLARLEQEGPWVIVEEDLHRNVERRMALYGDPSAFINVGGAEANLGVNPGILNLPPGLVEEEVALPPESQRGVVFEMLSRGVPVLHLLHVRGLTLRYGVPWDPIPLPEPGTVRLLDGHGGKGLWFWVISAAYGLALVVIGSGGVPWRRKSRGAGQGNTGV